MSQANLVPGLEGRVRVTQIIAGALVASAAIFLVVVLVMTFQGQVPTSPEPIEALKYVAVTVALVFLAAHFIVPSMVTEPARQRRLRRPGPRDQDAAWLLNVYLLQLIIGLAFLEGAAFTLLLTYMMMGDRSPLFDVGRWALYGAVLFIVLMALQFPTRPRVEQWLAHELQLLDQERSGRK